MLTPTKRTGCIINALNFNYDKLDKASNLMSKNFEKMDLLHEKSSAIIPNP